MHAADDIIPTVHVSEQAAATAQSSASSTARTFLLGSAAIVSLAVGGTVAASLQFPSVRSVVETSVPGAKPIIRAFESSPSPSAQSKSQKAPQTDTAAKAVYAPKPATAVAPAVTDAAKKDAEKAVSAVDEASAAVKVEEPTPSSTPDSVTEHHALPTPAATAIITNDDPNTKGDLAQTEHHSSEASVESEVKQLEQVVVETHVDQVHVDNSHTSDSATLASEIPGHEHEDASAQSSEVVAAVVPVEVVDTTNHEQTSHVHLEVGSAPPAESDVHQHHTEPSTEESHAVIAESDHASQPSASSDHHNPESTGSHAHETTAHPIEESAHVHDHVKAESDTTVTHPTAVDGAVQQAEEPLASTELSLEERLELAEGKVIQLLQIMADQEEAIAGLHDHHTNTLLDREQQHLANVAAEISSLKAEYAQALVSERREAEIEAMRAIQEHLSVQASTYEAKLVAELKAQAEEIRNQSEVDLRMRLGSERAQRIVMLERLFVRLKAVEAVLSNHAEAEATIRTTHMLFLATQELTSHIVAHQPLRAQFEYIRRIGATIPIVAATVDAVPASALDNGVATPALLNARFHDMKHAVRRVALVGEQGGLWSHVASYVASLLTLELTGYPEGEDTEAILARAEYWIKVCGCGPKGNV